MCVCVSEEAGGSVRLWLGVGCPFVVGAHLNQPPPPFVLLFPATDQLSQHRYCPSVVRRLYFAIRQRVVAYSMQLQPDPQ